jgi:hypothetical protein
MRGDRFQEQQTTDGENNLVQQEGERIEGEKRKS